MLKGFQNEAKMDAGAPVGSQVLDFGSQNLQNITNIAPKIYIKSMKNQGCVADAFLERFGAALWCQLFDFGSQIVATVEASWP
mgnify:CR=1 FL=1